MLFYHKIKRKTRGVESAIWWLTKKTCLKRPNPGERYGWMENMKCFT